MARQQPAAEGAQFALLDDKPELGRIEPEPAEAIGRAEPFGAQSRLAVGDQKFGEGGVGEHRDMAENIVKHRSEARRVGQQCVRHCGSGWAPYRTKKNNKIEIYLS